MHGEIQIKSLKAIRTSKVGERRNQRSLLFRRKLRNNSVCDPTRQQSRVHRSVNESRHFLNQRQLESY